MSSRLTVWHYPGNKQYSVGRIVHYCVNIPSAHKSQCSLKHIPGQSRSDTSA